MSIQLLCIKANTGQQCSDTRCSCPCHKLSQSYDGFRSNALGWELLHESFRTEKSHLYSPEYVKAL